MIKKGEFIYSAAAYLRLSRDDEDMYCGRKSESDSISSQRELVCSYIEEQEDMELFGTYADDGYSGADFDRPGFKRMMADVEAGKVNCVIVKDLSRLGRDYIEAGRLIQKIFPAFHVRFIALTDRYDSQTADYNTKFLFLPIKNFINESYCRDISMKVKSQQRIKREQGKFIGAFSVYGYQKSMKDKNKLCLDEYASKIVKIIFAWKREGMSAHAAAKRLNEMGILSPLEYKKSLGEEFSTGFRTNMTAKWSAAAVKRILTNEMYTGVMVQGKHEKINYKVKKSLEKPREEWTRVKDMHEAVISHEDFKTVQELLKVDMRAEKGSSCPHLFSGLLFCGDCKEPLIRRVNRYKDNSKVYFICSTRNKGKGCTRHSIPEEELKRIVLKILQVYLSVFLDVDCQREYGRGVEVNLGEVDIFRKEIKRLHREKDKYQEIMAELHTDLESGLITESDFRNFQAVYKKQYEKMEEAAEKQEGLIKTLFHNGITTGVRLERFKEEMKFRDLDRDMLLCFVSRIEVFEGKRVYVELHGKEEFQKK